MSPTHRLRSALLLPLGAFAALLAGSQRAHALASEHFGNAPVPPGWITFTADLRPLLNDPGRFYWFEVNGDARFFYRGDTAALNAMLRRFAAGGKGREVVLHAGPLERTSLTGSRRIEADWHLHVPGGDSLSDHADGGLVTDKGPALHVHVPRARPAAEVPGGRLAGWIKELDSDDFEKRQRASRELSRHGQAAEV